MLNGLNSEDLRKVRQTEAVLFLPDSFCADVLVLNDLLLLSY